MPRTMYKTCVEIMYSVEQAGYESDISWADLEQFIRKIAGSSDLTLQRYREELCTAGFLRRINEHMFKISIQPAP